MSRRIRRDLHKRVTSSGYQQIAGDLEVRGKLLGPTATDLATAIARMAAVTTTPVQLSAPTAEGSLRSISVFWTRQYNLSNFSHYEIQVSEDDLYWYSLRLDGSDWCDALNEDTDCRIEYFNHPNIPLVEDAGVLVGKKLYYRVRQVTMAGVKSEWSASCSATTKPVNDLVLTDSYNRYIEISSKKGIYADDRQGHIIHDIPNAPILSDMIYGGHIIWKMASADIVGITTSYTDTEISRSNVTSTVKNIDISSYTGGNTNIKGALVSLYMFLEIDQAKVQTGTSIDLLVRYCSLYNDTTGSNYSEMGQFKASSSNIHDLAGNNWSWKSRVQAVIPVVYNNLIPYISFYTISNFIYMVNANANYNTSTTLHLLGFFI